MDVFLARTKKLEPFREYSLKGKDIYVVSSDNLNNEHNIYGYLIFSGKQLTHVAIGNNSMTKDGCYMRGVMPASSLESFSDTDIDLVIEKVRAMHPYILESLELVHVIPRRSRAKKSTRPFICMKILVVNLFCTYLRGEYNKTFSSKMISELLSGITMRPIEIIVGQKITYKNEVEDYLLNLLSKSALPLYPKLIDSFLSKGADTRCIDNYFMKDKIKSNEFHIFTMEDCGQVLAKYSSSSLFLGNIFNDQEAMSSLLFQIYLSVLNINLYGFIHGDLHLSNVTVRESVLWKNMINYSKESCYVLYKTKVGDYYPKFYGAFPTLIDFSRSMFVDVSDKIKDKIKAEFGSEFETPGERIQAANMLDLLRLTRGLLILLRSTETDSNENVRLFLEDMISRLKSNAPSKEMSLFHHCAEVFSGFFFLRDPKDTCMQFAA